MVPRMTSVLDYADYESDISFSIRPLSVVYMGGATLVVYEVAWDIGHDSCTSRQELPEYTKIFARKKNMNKL
jgi:hypothetical protein